MLSNRSWDTVYEEIGDHLSNPDEAKRLLKDHLEKVGQAMSISARARMAIVDRRSPLGQAVDRVDDQLVHYYQRLSWSLAENRSPESILHIITERRALVRNAVTALEAVVGNTGAKQPEILGALRLMKELAGTN